MNSQQIFLLQFAYSVLIFGLLAYWVLSPALARRNQRDALFWLTVPHAFRHIGMVFLVPGVVVEPLPAYFAVPAAYGDLLTAFLALLALIMLRSKMAGALLAVWVFNLTGTIDLLIALRNPEIVGSFGAAWYIPTFIVPVLLVTHFMIFVRLLKPVVSARREVATN